MLTEGYRKCEDAVIAQLPDLLQQRLRYEEKDEDSFLDATQNARLNATTASCITAAPIPGICATRVCSKRSRTFLQPAGHRPKRSPGRTIPTSGMRGIPKWVSLAVMIRDRDRIYGTVVTRRLRAMGIRDKPTPPASPWQNGFAERLIGSIRRECLDHIIVLGEEHLRF